MLSKLTYVKIKQKSPLQMGLKENMLIWVSEFTLSGVV